MAQQTAVEWLEIQFEKYTSGGVNVPNNKIFKLTEKAKQMEKEQMLNVFQESRLTHPMIGFKHQIFLEYYNETYGKDI